MFKTISLHDFVKAFFDMDRANNFTYEGKKALFKYLESLEDDMGKPIELDVIALCCDYSEYKSLAEFQQDYDTEYESIKDVEDATVVIRMGEVDGEEAFIIQQF